MKPEIVFGLEGAAWPALLVSANGAVLRVNPMAVSTFGAVLAGDSPLLSAIWSPENGATDGQFLLQWEQQATATANLKFRIAAGAVKKFTVAICAFNKDGQKWYVLQLLPAAEPVISTTVPTPVSTTQEITASPFEKNSAADSAGVALKQKLDCALQLARTISLDFKNVLTSVLGHTSLLLGKAEPGHPWRHSLIEIEKAGSRAAEIANELATFSRQEKEIRRLPPGNVNTVMNRCVDFFRNAAGSKITWNLQLEKGLFGARFDEAKVQQALTKILENAVEAANTVSNSQITVQTRNVDLSEPTQDLNVRLAAGAYVCVEVSDNGSGIDAEVLPRIFDPFFTTKGKAHRGLGLALTYGIITNHGGGVAISSQLGAGTSARIYLPAEKELVRENLSGNENLSGTETILVVDDENMVVTMAETILMESGYKILTANDGQKALAILSRDDTPVDMVVTDLVMPGIGGRELVERIRRLAPAVKILCMSGCVMPADRQIGTVYLQKPFTSQDLLLKVKQALGSTSTID